jgi:hypothetical protein
MRLVERYKDDRAVYDCKSASGPDTDKRLDLFDIFAGGGVMP